MTACGVRADLIVGIALLILFLLFMIQRMGTGYVGVLFSPVVLIWFGFISSIGIYNIVKFDWRILRAISPTAWFNFFLRNGPKGYTMLGGVILCITGIHL
jgi:KUP system potassium uptake protein